MNETHKLHPAAGAPALAEFEDRLEDFFRQNHTALVRQHLRLGSVEDVKEALQEAMLRIYARSADGGEPEPDNLAAFVNVTVRNLLIDRLRRAAPVSLSLGDKDDEDQGSERELQDSGFSPPEDALAWKQLLHIIFERLPAKWTGVAAMIMAGASPEELGAAYRQNGYVLRRYTRELICKILGNLAQAGEPLAKSFGREFCGWAKQKQAAAGLPPARASAPP
jgi:DNA-directed RNA polymerase specialized sigma24 family protein